MQAPWDLCPRRSAACGDGPSLDVGEIVLEPRLRLALHGHVLDRTEIDGDLPEKDKKTDDAHAEMRGELKPYSPSTVRATLISH